MCAPSSSCSRSVGLPRYPAVRGIRREKRSADGSTKKKERTRLLADLSAGALKIIVGTHALLEPVVQFAHLGLAVIDEQHRFGVVQRSGLWQKGEQIHPHILIMSATPIPRTLAMTLYGDLDISVIDELPPGRKPIETYHQSESEMYRVYQFLERQLEEGRQAYVVFPMTVVARSICASPEMKLRMASSFSSGFILPCTRTILRWAKCSLYLRKPSSSVRIDSSSLSSIIGKTT